jgi:hypothetical protein
MATTGCSSCLLSIADEQGLDRHRIQNAFEAFDFSVPYYQQNWPLKVQRSRKEHPQLAAVTRVDGKDAHIFAELSDGHADRFYLLARTDVILEAWWSKLGHFVWRSSEEFCLMDREKEEVACRRLSEGAASIEQLIQ